MAGKVTGLRVFEDEDGKMNLSLDDVRGELLAVSQFTLLGDCRKGRRPSFVGAAPPEHAEELYEVFVEAVRDHGIATETGRFRAHMEVSLVNDGPVTLVIESPSGRPPPE
jgi:D-tyrosyl-tRNA(Tyr) deacylase